jgi:hypothetical protein
MLGLHEKSAGDLKGYETHFPRPPNLVLGRNAMSGCDRIPFEPNDQ